MLRFRPLIALTLGISILQGQTTSSSSSLSTQANLVVVPTQVKTKRGEYIYLLKAEQFVLTDNGAAQRIHLDDEPNGIGLSLVVLVQCTGAAALEITKLKGLETMVEGIVGDTPHQIAIVSFGAGPTLLSDFTSDSGKLTSAISGIGPCGEEGAATLDAVYYAIRLLEALHNSYRHEILLISETRDHGSHSTPREVIAALGRTNTVVNSVAFSPARDLFLYQLQHTDSRNLIPWFMAAASAMRRNAPSQLSHLSGGAYTNFETHKGFEKALANISNQVRNYYQLSFQPVSTPAYGFHSIVVTVPDYPDAVVRYRTSYWSGTTGSPAEIPLDPTQ
jgi:VWFA-related protein